MSHSPHYAKAEEILESVKGKSLTVEERRSLAIDLAAEMLREAQRRQTKSDRDNQQFLANMMEDPIGKVFTTVVTDQCFRSGRSSRVADQLAYLLNKMGIPGFLPTENKIGLLAFKWLGRYVPPISVPLVRYMIRKETARVILPGEMGPLTEHLLRRKKEGIRVNLNHLGEAILGEEEAAHRLETYLAYLSRPEVEYVSIKASTFFSQISTLSFQNTVEAIATKLRILFRAAAQAKYVNIHGEEVSKFVNLDMEEYRDVHITVAVFKKVLEEGEFYNFSAGIVLQGYLPDSFLLQQELTVWAMQRVASGGASIKIRIVKGANLAMEKLESALRGWPQAPYNHKVDVDANFKRMVVYGCQYEHAKAASLGIGTHNLFDIAYAMLLRLENRVEKYVCFEMLEGMADHIRSVVHSLTGDMLLYCPASKKEEFQNAIAYLVRRMDENTAPENFLRHVFNLIPGTTEWQQQASLFSLACHGASSVGFKLRRTQNRLLAPKRLGHDGPFENEVDTDFALAHNVKWAEQILATWEKKEIKKIPVVIDGKEIEATKNEITKEDPSQPGKIIYQHALAEETHAEQAVSAALNAQSSWGKLDSLQRSSLLAEVAHQMRTKRGDLIGAMVADTAKTVIEADIEVSEAIDFIEYYRRSAQEFLSLDDVQAQPKGPILIASPWNFPAAIPCSGIAAALAAGNTVLFKPAPEAVLVGYELAKIFWEGGIPRDVLQFIPCSDQPVAEWLVKNTDIESVILTGATETARHLLSLRPGLHLYAETGGKNAMIITSMADRDQAVRDIVHSAFGHAGQKCSAASLLILEEELYRDETFLQQLYDAAKSLPVGSAWNTSTKIAPLIRLPNAKLLRGLTSLDQGEKWLLEPKQNPKNPKLWSPGIKLGVKEGSFTHQNELFGPVLGVMCAKNLKHALHLANSTPFGLTSGIHTLDEREVAFWRKNIVSGNLYVNRGITGAIVQRQPFGGTKLSSFGAGAKAGGPNYVAQLIRFEQKSLPKEHKEIPSILHRWGEFFAGKWSQEESALWKGSLGSYSHYYQEYFSKKHDPTLLQGQDNLFYYVPHQKTFFRVQKGNSLFDIIRVAAAAVICGAPLEISGDKILIEELNVMDQNLWGGNIHFAMEEEQEFIKRLAENECARMRLISQAGESLLRAAAQHGISILDEKVLACGRLELLHYLREVSYSEDYHRYGNLGAREGEVRKPLP